MRLTEFASVDKKRKVREVILDVIYSHLIDDWVSYNTSGYGDSSIADNEGLNIAKKEFKRIEKLFNL